MLRSCSDFTLLAKCHLVYESWMDRDWKDALGLYGSICLRVVWRRRMLEVEILDAGMQLGTGAFRSKYSLDFASKFLFYFIFKKIILYPYLGFVTHICLKIVFILFLWENVLSCFNEFHYYESFSPQIFVLSLEIPES